MPEKILDDSFLRELNEDDKQKSKVDFKLDLSKIEHMEANDSFNHTQTYEGGIRVRRSRASRKKKV